MAGTFNKINHPSCRLDCQRVWGEAAPWRDIDCHFASKIALPIRCSCEQRDHQIFQRDHANAELHQLGICQLRDLGLRFSKNCVLLRMAWSCAALIIPPRKRQLALL